MSNLKLNPYFKSLSDAHMIVCNLCCGDWGFPWYYWIGFWPFNRHWEAYLKLNRVAEYLHQQFKKEPWFVK